MPQDADAGDTAGAESWGSGKIYFWTVPTAADVGEHFGAAPIFLPRPLTPLSTADVARRLVLISEPEAAGDRVYGGSG